MEEWKPVAGYEGFYDISNRGRVRSLDRIVNTKTGPQRHKGKTLKPSPDSSGHLQVILYNAGNPTRFAVHRLVAIAFLPKSEHEQVLHRDDEKFNNQVDNLYWGTPVDNMQDKILNGNNHETNKTQCRRGHLLIEPNLVRYQLTIGKRFCRSCAKAHDYLRYHKEDLKTVADRYYKEYMGEK